MKVTVKATTQEEMDRLEAEGIIKPTQWERYAMQLIEINRKLKAAEDRLNKLLLKG